MFLVEIITDAGYWSSTEEFDELDRAQAFARELRRRLAGTDGFVAVRVINFTHITRW